MFHNCFKGFKVILWYFADSTVIIYVCECGIVCRDRERKRETEMEWRVLA